MAIRRGRLPHSLVRNHAVMDGSKRQELAGLIAFCGVNGRRLPQLLLVTLRRMLP